MLVSVCTATYNRRKFIPALVACFKAQTYSGNMEWIIVDDGEDSIEDLVAHLPMVQYVRLSHKHPIGRKRNLMHSYCKGDILVYMDDDDYYPPERVSHAVKRLSATNALCAGSSEMYCYFLKEKQILKLGPYASSHATAATFAFKRSLLSMTSYNNDAIQAEEREFLKNYTIPFVQLDPFLTILVICHEENTVNKNKFLSVANKIPTVKTTSLTLKNFIRNKTMQDFYKMDE